MGKPLHIGPLKMRLNRVGKLAHMVSYHDMKSGLAFTYKCDNILLKPVLKLTTAKRTNFIMKGE